ncbi:MAG: hypothetical protein COA67_05745 [Lutibacter sp.]|nr:MAG: hypothetical protein COA67_05745 [Lutibacter sp.]
MRKIIISIVLLISIQLQAQKTFNYEHPHFEFENLIGVSSDFKQFANYDIELLTGVDISKLKFEKYNEKAGEGLKGKFYFDVPFYVNKEISIESDFVFALFSNVSWLILNNKKEKIVKSFGYIKNEKQETVGTVQNNSNLTEPISKPGNYYIRFILDEKPIKENIVFVFLSMITTE